MRGDLYRELQRALESVRTSSTVLESHAGVTTTPRVLERDAIALRHDLWRALRALDEVSPPGPVSATGEALAGLLRVDAGLRLEVLRRLGLEGA